MHVLPLPLLCFSDCVNFMCSYIYYHTDRREVYILQQLDKLTVHLIHTDLYIKSFERRVPLQQHS